MREEAADDAFFEGNPFDLAHQMLGDASGEPTRPQNFGSYRFLEQGPLGSGSMADVWLAEEAGVGRLVAAKLLRHSSEPDVWARREIERLGALEHQYIARLYNHGILDDGTPWLAMEYVDGEPLDQYCRERRCSLKESLALFRKICEAVQYAHGRGIIHGDLKPSNIRVKKDGQPKLLDFGLSEQLQSTDGTVTQSPSALGFTPAYAAPEQFRGEPVGVYVDVYALGVILYELLAGVLPFDSSRYTFAEMEGMKSGERKPVPPSIYGRGNTRLTTTEWRDLDAVCLKALEPDINRRYSSAESLMQDLDRFGNCQPLDARLPHSAPYRFRKFVKRRRAGLLAAALVLVVIAGLVTAFALRLADERNKAVAEAARTERVEQFMENLFQGDDDQAGPSKDLRVVTILDRGVKEAQGLTADPTMQADFYQTLGTVYQALGQFDRAEPLLESALITRRSVFGPEHKETADTLVRLGALRLAIGQLPEAERLAREAIAINQRHLPESALPLVKSMTLLGKALEQRGVYDQAIQTLNAAAVLLPDKGRRAKELSDATSSLATAYFHLGDYSRANSLNKQALSIDGQIYGQHHPNLAEDLINLGQIQSMWGHYPEAEKYYRQALDIHRSWYGKDSVQEADAAIYLAESLELQSREAEAEGLLKQALAALEHSYGKVHPRVAIAVGLLGAVAKDLNKLDEAEADFEREFAIFRSVYGEDHQSTAIALSNLASVYKAKKQFSKAEQGFRDVIRRFSKTLGPDHLNMGIARIKLGETLLGEKRYAEAEDELRAGYSVLTKQTSTSAWSLQVVRKDLATVYDALKEPANAAQFRAGLSVPSGN